MRYVEDPSVAGAARAEHAELMSKILERYERGESFFIAREQVMAEHGPRLAKLYGKETAKRALQAVTSHGLMDLPRASRLKHFQANADRMLEANDNARGPGHHWTARQRFWLSVIGLQHWSLDPMVSVAAFVAVPLLVIGAYLAGWLSIAGILLLLIAAVVVIDFATSPIAPRGQPLEGATLEAWRQGRLESEATKVAAAAEAARLEADKADADRAEALAMTRTLRDFANAAERDARARQASRLPSSPPLDDVGKRMLRR